MFIQSIASISALENIEIQKMKCIDLKNNKDVDQEKIILTVPSPPLSSTIPPVPISLNSPLSPPQSILNEVGIDPSATPTASPTHLTEVTSRDKINENFNDSDIIVTSAPTASPIPLTKLISRDVMRENINNSDLILTSAPSAPPSPDRRGSPTNASNGIDTTYGSSGKDRNKGIDGTNGSPGSNGSNGIDGTNGSINTILKIPDIPLPAPTRPRDWVPCHLCGLDCTWAYIMHSDASRALVTHHCR